MTLSDSKNIEKTTTLISVLRTHLNRLENGSYNEEEIEGLWTTLVDTSPDPELASYLFRGWLCSMVLNENDRGKLVLRGNSDDDTKPENTQS